LNPKVTKLLSNLSEQLNFINLEIDNQSIRCENAISIILKTITNLKGIVEKIKFTTDTEEIQFFKEIKPQFTSKLIYYNVLFKLK
jgi:hypothetical protein